MFSTPDKRHTIKNSVPIYDKYGNVVGYEIADTGIWSHATKTDTDIVWKRGTKIYDTERETKKLLKEFVSGYGSLLKNINR